MLILPKEDVESTSRTCLQHYTYYWPDPNGGPETQAIALGLGSMFNHSTLRQNVVWKRDVEAGTITYTAHRDIESGEELCISYGSARLWFNDVEAEEEANGFHEQDELVASGLDVLARMESNEYR